MRQATEDGSDELRRSSGRRCTSDGDSACSREHAADVRVPQGTAAAAAAAVAAAAAADFSTDPFAAMRVVQGLAAAHNRAGWAAASQLPIAALLSVPPVVGGGDAGGTVPASFAFPMANGQALWSSYSASLHSTGIGGELVCIAAGCLSLNEMYRLPPVHYADAVLATTLLSMSKVRMHSARSHHKRELCLPSPYAVNC